MNHSTRAFKFPGLRLALYAVALLALIAASGSFTSVNVSANHPVLVEGNCDSPVPGTTIVSPAGTCGDYDGDGRIGTAEDTDGADRIFGTLKAALGPGTGAAAGTGANNNGRITIVKSGRFAEQLLIGMTIPAFPDQGSATPGNVTIEAAPGVEANIDAVLQGDPAGGNTARQAGPGITIFNGTTNTPTTVVTLRNLVIRNFANGIVTAGSTRVNIDNCRIENNRDNGILITDFGQVVVSHSKVQGNGFRIPVSGSPNPGAGITVTDGAQARIFHTVVSNNAGPGIASATGNAASVVLYKVVSSFNTPDLMGPITIAPNPNFSN
ncbi:MAG TPA: right-handed parallel beta-helix repeat-containing protein [Pyrinomonadaceae bacterium]|nr:right-handed parallel beta-helix repeat-containing protein [Pyrinomonadaceae bacterium]